MIDRRNFRAKYRALFYLSVLNAGFCLWVYWLHVQRGNVLFATVQGVCVLINAYLALIGLGYAQCPRIRRWQRRPAAVQFCKSLQADDFLITCQCWCLVCRERFERGDAVTVILFNPTEDAGFPVALPNHTRCVSRDIGQDSKL